MKRVLIYVLALVAYCTAANAQSIIDAANTSSIAFGNARGVRNIFEKLLVEQANRISASAEVTREQLMQIMKEDVLAARASDTQLAKAEEERRRTEENAKEAMETLEKLASELNEMK